MSERPSNEPAWTHELWAAGEPVYRQILRHPFLTGLTDGTLPRAAFRYFLVQDGLYLREYARALALTGTRADNPGDLAMFTRHAAEAIAVEQELHAGLLADLGEPDLELDAAEAGPVTTAYTSYLLAVCGTGSYAEAVATVLPCYWIYREVGRELLARSSPDPAYARWIATYGSPEFDATVAAVLSATDRLGRRISAADRARGRRHYTTTTRYEWMFWDAAHRQAAWPV